MGITKENLAAAFAGESQANRRYLVSAEKADAEGQPQVARLFRAVAAAETVHAKSHLRVLGTMGNTTENLKAWPVSITSSVACTRNSSRRPPRTRTNRRCAASATPTRWKRRTTVSMKRRWQPSRAVKNWLRAPITSARSAGTPNSAAHRTSAPSWPRRRHQGCARVRS